MLSLASYCSVMDFVKSFFYFSVVSGLRTYITFTTIYKHNFCSEPFQHSERLFRSQFLSLRHAADNKLEAVIYQYTATTQASPEKTATAQKPW